jgi:arsenate reductase
VLGTARAAKHDFLRSLGDVCPVFPGRRYEDWALPDPAGLPAAGVRPIRDAIDARVRALPAELLPA